ncbi:MAG: hypothetical protein M0Z46_15130 [Actinomycetota bacterium]|nr:hypothetical protein [Actinomycetota bacterium]
MHTVEPRSRRAPRPRRRRATLSILTCAVALVTAVLILVLPDGGAPNEMAARRRHLPVRKAAASAGRARRRASATPRTAQAWIAQLEAKAKANHVPGHLAPGSNPGVLPGPVLIADRNNSRLLLVDPQGQILWQYPPPGNAALADSLPSPDDAFFGPHGHHILATEESQFAITEISVPTDRIVWHYGHLGTPGSAPGYLDNPDDAMLLPNGNVITADIKNCRLLYLSPSDPAPVHIYGETTPYCYHQPPTRFGSPNGMFPMTNGDWLVTEINGDWVDEMTPRGQIVWSVHPPGITYPSDTNEVSPGVFLTTAYTKPGVVEEFNTRGQVLWRYAPTGTAALNQPSLALPLPNGDVLLNDDWNDRVIVVDPKTDQVVWQYGVTGVPGSAPGYLFKPDGVDLAPPYSLLMRHATTMGIPPFPVPSGSRSASGSAASRR